MEIRAIVFITVADRELANEKAAMLDADSGDQFDKAVELVPVGSPVLEPATHLIIDTVTNAVDLAAMQAMTEPADPNYVPSAVVVAYTGTESILTVAADNSLERRRYE